jgi:hypothetical protein
MIISPGSLAATEAVDFKDLLLQGFEYQDQRFNQHQRAFNQKVVEYDVDEAGVKRVREDCQERLDYDDAKVEGQFFEVVQDLLLSQLQDIVHEHDICSEREHVGVIVSRHQVFDDVDQEPKALLAERPATSSGMFFSSI